MMMTSQCVVMVILSALGVCSWASCRGPKQRDRLVTVTDEVYYMVFRIQPGLKTSAYSRFMDTGNNDDNDPLQLDFEVPCGCTGPDGRLFCDRHFRSRLQDRWEHLPIHKVRVGVHKDGEEKMFLLFDGRNSTFTDWFAKSRLLSSSYTDLSSSTKTNFFSVEGDGQRDRRFFIHRDYKGCAQDMGWMVVVDGPSTSCPSWEKQTGQVYPAILYSPLTTATNYSKTLEKADVLIISVSLKTKHCYSLRQ